MAEDVDKLADLATALAPVTAGNGVLDAMRNVVFQDFLLRAPQGRAHRRNLGHHIDAVAIGLDHAGKPAHLTLDAAQPPQA